MDWEGLGTVAHRRHVTSDGRVVDVRMPPRVHVDAGRVESLQPARVRLRDGTLVDVDALLDTGVTVAVGDPVVVLMHGGFVLAAKVRLL